MWTVRRPLVYRSIEILAGGRLIEPAGTERSTSGPPRTILKIASDGRRLLGHWLCEPVTRVRQARSELMLKLLSSIAPEAIRLACFAPSARSWTSGPVNCARRQTAQADLRARSRYGARKARSPL